MAKKGIIFDIKHYAIHDGPGIRTTIFLKGCPLNCLWCHSPESQLIEPQFSFSSEKCIGCLECLKTCPRDTIKKPGLIDFENCDLCGKCAQICYSNAIKIIGKEISVGELEVVKKDYSFYERSGGGVTLSGGNPQHNRISH